MKRAHCASIRAVHSRAWIIGLAVVWMAAAVPAWGQSAVWQPQGATTGNIYYNGGNVGIGTANPGYKLDLNGTLRIPADTNFSIGTPDVMGGQGAWISYNSGGDYLSINAIHQGLRWTPIVLANGGNGNVGIGTADPQYKLAVNGTIGAQDIIVTNAGWSDYVFRPGYRLRPLSEVGAYIRAHRHLPDIPSEAEVKAQGVSVGEMQAKLLAKIEELTLHMIQQDKENRELRERVAQLESRAAASGAPAGGR